MVNKLKSEDVDWVLPLLPYAAIIRWYIALLCFWMSVLVPISILYGVVPSFNFKQSTMFVLVFVVITMIVNCYLVQSD